MNEMVICWIPVAVYPAFRIPSITKAVRRKGTLMKKFDLLTIL
jgi:hypothetical protein